jgi:long-chain fatty acid transport protein
LGCQKKFSDLVTGRVGYTYNQNPVKNSEAFYNIATPLFYQHMLSLGGSLTPNENVSFNAGYSYLLDNTRSGQIVQPGLGNIPGSAFENSLSGHFLSFGISMSH